MVKQRLAERFDSRRLLRPVLEAWSNRAQIMSHRKQLAEQKYRIHANELLR